MARRRKEPDSGIDVEFVDEPPRKRRSGESWAALLEPVFLNPGRWARVWIADTPEQAQAAQSNLHTRKVIIPGTNGTWEFASRGVELYAVYRGSRKRGSVRRTNRKR
jgi:hypothetical protein